jgi:chorismate dehydratase
VETSEPNDGFLLIGDEALRHRQGYAGYPYVTDLGAVWHDHTGLPFVGSVWMARRSLPHKQKEYLKTVLSNSLNEGWKHFDAAVHEKMEDLQMTRAEVREYLDGLRFRLGAPEQDAIAKFIELDTMTRNLEAVQRDTK